MDSHRIDWDPFVRFCHLSARGDWLSFNFMACNPIIQYQIFYQDKFVNAFFAPNFED